MNERLVNGRLATCILKSEVKARSLGRALERPPLPLTPVHVLQRLPHRVRPARLTQRPVHPGVPRLPLVIGPALRR